MSRFDINKPADFTRLTLGNIGSILQDLDNIGRKPSEWDILEGSYNGVLFHVFKSKSDYQGALNQVQDTEGRRKVKYQFPYKDGQTTDDLGRKPAVFDMDILIHGNTYMKGLRAIMAEFNKPQPGDLVHPVRGKFRVAVEDVQVIHASDKRKAAALRVTFIEHNFTIGDIKQSKDASVKGALSKALDFVGTLQNAILQVQGVVKLATTIKNKIVSGIEEFKSGYGLALGNINTNLNVNGATDFPSILPVNVGGNLKSDGTTDINITQAVQATAESDQPIIPAIAAETIRKQVESLRQDAATIIQDIQAQGTTGLLLTQVVLDIKQAAILLQEAYERGVASSQAQVIDFVAPRLMSTREVAFLNGLDVNRVGDVNLLNPELESTNYVPKGTVVRVPIA